MEELNVIEIEFKNGEKNYYLKESPAINSFQKIVSERKIKVISKEDHNKIVDELKEEIKKAFLTCNVVTCSNLLREQLQAKDKEIAELKKDLEIQNDWINSINNSKTKL